MALPGGFRLLLQGREEMGAEELEGGGGGTGFLGVVIPAAQLDALTVTGMSLELGNLRAGHGSSLENEALSGGCAQFAMIGGVDGAEVAFGRNMQAHGCHGLVAETSGKPVPAHVFMAVINSLIGSIVGKIVEQVANIVEEGGSYQRLAGTSLQREGGGLQAVLQLADSLEPILRVTVLPEQLQDEFDFACRVGGHVVHRW